MWSLCARTKNRLLAETTLLLFLLSSIPLVAAAAENTEAKIPSRLESLPDFAPLAEKLAPVVVNISATQAPPAADCAAGAWPPAALASAFR